MWVCVCVCVCSDIPGYKVAKERYQRPQCYVGMNFKMVFFLKRVCCKDRAFRGTIRAIFQPAYTIYTCVYIFRNPYAAWTHLLMPRVNGFLTLGFMKHVPAGPRLLWLLPCVSPRIPDPVPPTKLSSMAMALFRPSDSPLSKCSI